MMTQFEVPFDSVVKGGAWAASRDIPVIIDAGPALPLPLEELRGAHDLLPQRDGD